MTRRLTFDLAPGGVAKLKVPVYYDGWFSRQTVDIEILVEVRDVKDGRAQLVVVGPGEGKL